MDRGVNVIHANYLLLLTTSYQSYPPPALGTHTAPIETKPSTAPEPVTSKPPSTKTYTTSPQTETPQHPGLYLYNPVRHPLSIHQLPRHVTATSPHYPAERLPNPPSAASSYPPLPPLHHPVQPPTSFSVVLVALAVRLERACAVRGWLSAQTREVNSLL